MSSLYLLTALLVCAGTVYGQEEYVLHLRNGKRLVGRIVQESSGAIVVETVDGRVTLGAQEVERRTPYLVDRASLSMGQDALVDQRYLEAIALFQEAYRNVEDPEIRRDLQEKIESAVDQWVRQSEQRSGSQLDWSDADKLSRVEGLIESADVLERLKAEVWRIRNARARYLLSVARRQVEDKRFEEAESTYRDLADHGFPYPRELAEAYLQHALRLMTPPEREHDKALRLLLRARETYPDLFLTHLYLAQAYLELDSEEMARDQLRQAGKYIEQFSAAEKQLFAQLMGRLARAARFPTFAPIPTVSPNQIVQPPRRREYRFRYWWNRLKWFYQTGRWKEGVSRYWYFPAGGFAILLVVWYLPWRYVRRDYSRRTMVGPNWSTVVFLTGIVGLLAYLVVRTVQESRKVRCKRCGYNLSRLGDYADYDFGRCPGCKAPIKPVFNLAEVIVSRAKLLVSGAALSSVDTGSEEELFRLVCVHAFRSRAERAQVYPEGKDLAVTFLIDGVAHPVFTLPGATGKVLLLAARKKTNIDSSAPYPQTGYFVDSMDDTDVEIRLTIRTSDLGESLILRLIDRRTGVLDISQIGLDENQQALIREELAKDQGLIAITGPPGSGRTTLAYAMLRHLNDGQHYLATLESPIHLELPGVTQIDESRTGVKGKRALEMVLRQNVDVLFVEQVRDRESFQLLLQASSTTRRTITCLDTQDAVSAVGFLLSDEIDPQLVSEGLSMIVAVRLLRKLCPSCKAETRLRRKDLERLNLPADQLGGARLFSRKGCEACSRTGYSGRTGVFEILPMSEDLKQGLRSGRSHEELLEVARRDRLGDLRSQAMRKVLMGVTDLEELVRVMDVAAAQVLGQQA